MGVEFGDTKYSFIYSLIHSFVKCQLGDTPAIQYYVYIVIG